MNLPAKSTIGQDRTTPTGTSIRQESTAQKGRPLSVAVYMRFGNIVEAFVASEGRRYTLDEWKRRCKTL